MAVGYMTEQEMDWLLAERHGWEIQGKLKAAHVAVAGLGGLGSNIAIMLARAGVGSLHLADFDRVDGSNLNRQNYRMEHLGRAKTEALAEEIREINPYIKIRKDRVKVTEENVKELFGEARLLCEAFDRADQKAMLVNTVLEQLPDTVIVAGSGMAGYGSGNQIQTQKKFNRLYLCGDGTSDVDQGNYLMAPRVMLCAAHQAHMILRLILGDTEP